MPTTSDYLTQLQQDREDLIDNLETQGITGLTGDETFTELVPEVLNISGGGGLVEIHDMRYFTYNGNRATEIPTLKQLFKNVEKWEYAFTSINSNYTTVTEIDLTGATTSETTDVTMSGMFNNDWSVTKIIVPNIINGHVTMIDNMFNGCQALTTVDLSGSDVSSIRYYSSMFNNCKAITTIDLDSVNGTYINGGTVIATGNMVDQISNDSQQIGRAHV